MEKCRSSATAKNMRSMRIACSKQSGRKVKKRPRPLIPRRIRQQRQERTSQPTKRWRLRRSNPLDGVRASGCFSLELDETGSPDRLMDRVIHIAKSDQRMSEKRKVPNEP